MCTFNNYSSVSRKRFPAKYLVFLITSEMNRGNCLYMSATLMSSTEVHTEQPVSSPLIEPINDHERAIILKTSPSICMLIKIYLFLYYFHFKLHDDFTRAVYTDKCCPFSG